jgi:hypothetical protein
MVETPMIGATGTITFSRKVSVRPYESAEAGIYVQFDIPTDPDMSEETRGDYIIANARAAFFQAKALVYEELGLEFTVGENGVVHELLTNHFGAVTEVVTSEAAPAAPVAPAPAAIAPTPASSDSDTPPFSPDTNDKTERAANTRWAKDLYSRRPDAFYDNRPKKASGEYKPTAPDVKHKDTKIGVWLS